MLHPRIPAWGTLALRLTGFCVAEAGDLSRETGGKGPRPMDTESREGEPSPQESAPGPDPQPLAARVVGEIKARPVAYVTLLALLIIAPILLKMIFPDATPGVLAAGTIAFTAYAAACTVPGRFL